MDEEQALAFLDEDGALRRTQDAPLSEASAYLVFSQAPRAAIDVTAWQRQATRFFQTRVGLALARASEVDERERDAYLFLVEPPQMAITRRLVFVRPRTPDDLVVAERIDAEKGAQGLSALAARCANVCLIESEGPDDRAALLLAALAASILLGPILPPNRDDIFGVRTAREKLGQAPRPV